MRAVTARLKELYRTKVGDVVLMTSSGTGGLESAIQKGVVSDVPTLRAFALTAVEQTARGDGIARSERGQSAADRPTQLITPPRAATPGHHASRW